MDDRINVRSYELGQAAFDSLRTLVQRIWDMGFDAVKWLWRYLLLGAAVVVPIWLILRLMRAARG